MTEEDMAVKKVRVIFNYLANHLLQRRTMSNEEEWLYILSILVNMMRELSALMDDATGICHETGVAHSL